MAVIKTQRIKKKDYYQKLEVVNWNEKQAVREYIFYNYRNIDHFEYGHIPGHRVYKVVLTNGKEKKWEFERVRS